MPGNPCLKPHGQSFDRGAATFVITLHCSTAGVRCGLYPSAMVLDLVPTSGCCHWRAQSPVFLPSQFEEVMVAALAAKRWHRGVAHYREWSLFWGPSDEYTCVCKRRFVKRGQLPQHNKGWSQREWKGAKALCSVDGILMFLVPSAQSPNPPVLRPCHTYIQAQVPKPFAAFWEGSFYHWTNWHSQSEPNLWGTWGTTLTFNPQGLFLQDEYG